MMESPSPFLSQLFLSPEGSPFSIPDALLAMTITTLLCFVLAHTYRTTHRGTGYSQSLPATMFLVGIATSIVMMIIGSNIARAFSLVGALSIIRFRTAVKDPRDTGFLFAAIVAGMGCGTQFYMAVILMCVFLSVLMKVLFYFDFGVQGTLDVVLRVSTREDGTAEQDVEASLEKALSHPVRRLHRISEVEEGCVTSVFVLEKPGPAEVEAVEQELRKIEGVLRLSVYETDQHAPV